MATYEAPTTDIQEGSDVEFLEAYWATASSGPFPFTPSSFDYTYSVTSGSASPDDYEITPILDSFSVGDITYTRLSFLVSALDDGAIEGDEGFVLTVDGTISGPGGSESGTSIYPFVIINSIGEEADLAPNAVEVHPSLNSRAGS